MSRLPVRVLVASIDLARLVAWWEGTLVPQDPEDWLVEWQQSTEQQAQVGLELSQRMREVSATAESAGGKAVVVVDHSGGMAGLTLTASAMRLSADELAATILATSRRAQAQLAEKVAELVTGIYGSDSSTAAFISGAYAEQFPTPPDDDEGRAGR